MTATSGAGSILGRGHGLTPPTAGGPLPDRQVREADRTLAQACQDVEELFLTQLLGALRRTLLTGLKKADSQGEKYQALADQEVARALAAGGGLGLARTLYQHVAGARLPRPERDCHGEREPEPPRDPGGPDAAAAGGADA
ncbi:MAG: hypothetical protein K6T55_04985 [Syntrophobacterales bacterium]|nr:hypothetical protein [Syntrophobacterales bacterium]